MTPVEIALEIRTIPIFERLTTRQLFDLAGVVREEEHPADTEIIRDGDDGSFMYFIVSGTVRVVKDDRTIADLGARDFFGEMALFEGEKRSATCVTATPAKLLRIERADLLSLMEEMPSIAIGICQSLSARIRNANARA
jgi:CRP/FNR family transcriptional regulator